MITDDSLRRHARRLRRYADVITGAGEGGGAHVRVFNGRSGVELQGFFPAASTSGVRVAAGDVNGDGRADIITALGPAATIASACSTE